MRTPATPLDNQAAIAQMGIELRSSIGLLIDEFVRPNAIALAETRAICDSNARSIEAEGVKVRELRESVELLRSVADDAAGEVAEVEPRISENEQRFQNLLDEAREDRRRSDERFAEMDRDLAEQRRLSDERFNAMLQEIRAIGEQNRALLSALATTNGRVDSLEQAG